MKKYKSFKVCLITILTLLFVLSFAIALSPVSASEFVKPSDVIAVNSGVSGFENGYTVGSQEGSTDFKGLYVKKNSERVSISFDKVIDAKILNKEDALLEVQFLGLGAQDYSKAKGATLYLTDANDPFNRIGVGFYYATDMGEQNGLITYYRVVYNGQTLHYKDNTLMVDFYGECSYNSSLFPGKFSSRAPHVIRFDYTEKTFYVDSHNGVRPILDLDSPEQLGEDLLWKGFEGDKCLLSFEVEYEDSKNGGFIIGQMLGRDLSVDSFDLNENIPSAFIIAPDGHSVESLPKAEVGTPYKLPKLDTFDFIYDEVDINFELYREGENVSSELVDDTFIATKPGVIKIVYTVTSLGGTIKSVETFVTVVHKLAPFSYSKSNDSFPILGEYFDVPVITVTGKSGIIAVEETVIYNGKRLDLSKSRKVLIDEVGSVTISLTAQGYTGEKESTVFVYSVSLDKACIVVDSMPFSVEANTTFVVPDFKVICKQGVAENKKVYVGDVDVSESMSYNVIEEIGSVISVKFCGGSGDSYNEVIYNVRVVKNNYNLSDYLYIVEGTGSVVDSSEDGSVLFSAETDATMQTAFPVSLYKLEVSFAFDGSHVNSLDICLTGYENRSDSLFFRVGYLTAETSSLMINGKGERFVLPVKFTEMSDYKFIINNVSGELYFGNKIITTFDKMSSFGAVVSFKLNGVDKKSDVYINKISNQSFNPKAYLMGDNVPAHLALSSNIETYRQLTACGASLELPSAKAYDVLSDGATVSLVVVSPTKEKLYNGDIFEPKRITISEYGMYIIQYVVKDAKGNSATFNYNVELIDKINPVITVNNKPNSLYSVGDVLEISSVEVSDNYDTQPVVEIFLKNNTSGSVVLINESEYKLTEKGKYTLVYKVRDLCYNFAKVEYQIEVVE